MQRTLVIIKPDAIQRGLVGQITTRFEQKGLKLAATKMSILSNDLLGEHYSHHKERSFFPGLVSYMQSSPVVIQVWEGVDVVSTVRKLTGVTKARDAEAGSIRGDFAMSHQMNIIHCSDSIENAEAEVARFFTSEELFDYDKTEWTHVYASDEK